MTKKYVFPTNVGFRQASGLHFISQCLLVVWFVILEEKNAATENTQNFFENPSRNDISGLVENYLTNLDKLAGSLDNNKKLIVYWCLY